MTNKQLNETIDRVNDLYYDIITGNVVNEGLFNSLIQQLKQAGYIFIPLCHEYVTGLYERHKTTLHNEEAGLKEQMAQIVYFTTNRDKSVTFFYARETDGWIWK